MQHKHSLGINLIVNSGMFDKTTIPPTGGSVSIPTQSQWYYIGLKSSPRSRWMIQLLYSTLCWHSRSIEFLFLLLVIVLVLVVEEEDGDDDDHHHQDQETVILHLDGWSHACSCQLSVNKQCLGWICGWWKFSFK